MWSNPFHSIMKPLLLCCLLVLTGCRHTQPQYANLAPALPAEQSVLQSVALTNRLDPAWLQPPAEPFTLGPGDRVDIELIGETNSLTTTIVGPDGKVYFNLLPGIDVWGLTVPQTQAKLEQEMTKYVRNHPQVSLMLRTVESKRVWVLGRVQAPGIYSITAPMTLLEALSTAGGTLSSSMFRQIEGGAFTEELADLRRSFLLRQGKLLPVDFERLVLRGDLSQNIYLEPDDFIYLPALSAREVYVLGAVAQPRPVPYKPGLTVASAVASAYGTLNGAYMHHVAVVRGSLHHPQVAIVDYKRVIRGQAQDMALEAGDIVYVPFSPFRYLQRYLEVILNTFVSSAAINAGSRAVGERQIAGAGVFIPVGSGVQIIPPVSPPPIR